MPGIGLVDETLRKGTEAPPGCFSYCCEGVAEATGVGPAGRYAPSVQEDECTGRRAFIHVINSSIYELRCLQALRFRNFVSSDSLVYNGDLWGVKVIAHEEREG